MALVSLQSDGEPGAAVESLSVGSIGWICGRLAAWTDRRYVTVATYFVTVGWGEGETIGRREGGSFRGLLLVSVRC